MAYKIEEINPLNCVFSFRMDEYDCYALKTGRCSLYLSDAEAAEVNKTEKGISESNVMYCRDLRDSLLNVNYFEEPDFQTDIYSIRIHQRACGHYVFTDGQHRSCIAKHLNLNKMYVKKAIESSNDIICPACLHKENTNKENNFFSSVFSLFKRNKGESRKIPYFFIDDEYIDFQDTAKER